MRKSFTVNTLVLVVLAVSFASGPSTSAQSIDEVYRTKGLTIVVGYSPGGAYDIMARVLARHIGRQLPGTPTVVVQNMPGAGSLRAANYIFNQAPKDGTQIAAFASGLSLLPLIDPQRVRYDAQKLGWIGSAAKEVSIAFAWHTKPFKSLDDARLREMVVPGTGSGANSVIMPRLLNAVLGTRFKIVSGYPGSPETMMAIERGEADGHVGGTLDNLMLTHPDWLPTGKVRILLQIAPKRHPKLADVPVITELPMSDADRRVLDMVLLRQSQARPFAAPPGLPPERLAVLRRAFDAAMADAAFVAEARKNAVEIEPTTGVEMERTIRSVYASSPEAVARARAILLDDGKLSGKPTK
jgi:tripartite-type tricarboxylate transporter receptor subunit TctC